jgi:hypothetical protein
MWYCRKWGSCVDLAKHVGKIAIIYITSGDKMAFRAREYSPAKQLYYIEE